MNSSMRNSKSKELRMEHQTNQLAIRYHEECPEAVGFV